VGVWEKRRKKDIYSIMAEKCFEIKAKFRMSLYPAAGKGNIYK
jgi:hypothetical protein